MESEWFKEARRYAAHRYAYPQMVDEFPDFFVESGDPYDRVDEFGERYDLDRQDDPATWGINSGTKFIKEKF